MRLSASGRRLRVIMVTPGYETLASSMVTTEYSESLILLYPRVINYFKFRSFFLFKFCLKAALMSVLVVLKFYLMLL